MEYSLKIADFLFKRIENTIANKRYVKGVNIDYSYGETYGNEYIKVSYSVDVFSCFEELTIIDQQRIFQGSPNFIFSLSTYADRRYWNRKERFLSLVKFKQIYECIAVSAVLKLERGLNPGTGIKIKSIDLWPDANYAEKYLLSQSYNDYQRGGYDLELDIIQWPKLHRLAKLSRKIYGSDKVMFDITDHMLKNYFHLNTDNVRRIILKYQVPICVKGIKTIDKLLIHSGKLVEALKQEIKANDYLNQADDAKYRELVNYLYDYHLPKQKSEIILEQQAEFLENLTIAPGDILELNDGRVVVINKLSFEAETNLYVNYSILKNNLQAGDRTRTIKVNYIAYLLKESEFLKHIQNVPVRNISILRRWMQNRKVKMVLPVFEPNLLKE